MTKIAVMQPYLFPYIGYFQLIKSVDKFVIFDDVNFIKKGWINRNRILLDGKEHLFALPLNNASQNRLIKDITIFDHQKSKQLLLKKILLSYQKACYFEIMKPLMEEIITFDEEIISKYIGNSLIKICQYIGINADFIYSSDLNYDRNSKGQEKIISIVKTLGGTIYHNLPGGIDLYDKESFEQNDVKLRFIDSKEISYKQFSNSFIGKLSIIDVLMLNSKEEIKKMIDSFNMA